MDPIRVLVIDEQPLFRAGVRATLQRMGDCIVVGEATEAEAIIELARTHQPDVALLDGDLMTADPMEIAGQLRQLAPHLGVILLAPSEDEERLFQAITVGVAAFYLRMITPDALMEAVRKVGQGEYLLTEAVFSKLHLANRVLTSLRELVVEDKPTPDPTSPLSSREMEILDSIAQGNSNKQIGQALHISDQTVKNHVTSILKKVSAADRTSAVVHALKHGWIALGEPTARRSPRL